MKRVFAYLTAFLMALNLCSALPAAAAEGVPTLHVDMAAQQHPILHGSAGFLYGISNEGVPDVNTLTPLKPKVLATKGALGTEHPYGDALDVAEEFFEAGGEQVQMYCSNYYGVFGVTAQAHDYGKVLETIIAPTVADWKDEKRAKYPDIDSRIVYIPINEGTPRNYNGSQERTIMNSWKVFYDAIKRADPGAVIAGPNNAEYGNSYAYMRQFLTFCRDNNCLPDIVTWHELQVSCLDTMDDHIADYRSICRDLGIEEKQVVINEYADYADCGVPGRLVNWISRLEDNRVYGCLPFWHQPNNLNDLTASANQGNGAWWVYKWYGDMSGTTLRVSGQNTRFDEFYGLASLDENKRSASVLCGGSDGAAMVHLENLSDTAVFQDADRVHVQVEASYFSGYHGAAYAPEVVSSGVYPVTDGMVEIPLADTKFSSAYFITITEATAPVSEPSVGSFRRVYEAEDARWIGSLFREQQNSPLERPPYFCSGGVRVGGFDQEGDGIEYVINVPTDGLYKLSFLYGNGVGSTRNNASTHHPKNITQTLLVDGEARELLLPNTLFYSMESAAEEYVDLTAGNHRITLMVDGAGGVFHDALTVSYAGAYGEEKPRFDKTYEAEAADFNVLGASEESALRTATDLFGYRGNGYVSNLHLSPVEDGGGLRWIVDVEESALYHLMFRYTSAENGTIRVYLDNTNQTFDHRAADAAVEGAAGEWKQSNVTLFLRQGINLIDVDADCDIGLDSMRVVHAAQSGAIVLEAEDAAGNFETATAAGGERYVKEMLGAAQPDQYMELSVHVETDGLYKMQVFQSNDDLCGTHSYNIKIIDRYATFEVNGDQASAQRYFFPNTFSDDTFLERTIPLNLKAGENRIKIYNDDSWHVLWGGSQSTPGTNQLVNYTPNFDKFILSPAAVAVEEMPTDYPIALSSTKYGKFTSSKNFAAVGDRVTVYLVPEGAVRQLTLNGEDITAQLQTTDGTVYVAEITAGEENNLFASFTPAQEEAYPKPDIDNSTSVEFQGTRYRKIGDNLYQNGDFSDNSGADMDAWYVGANPNGHPENNDYTPRISADGSLVNLTPLAESGSLTTGAFEQDAPDTFYYGKDWSNTYLVEHMSSDWTHCAWNGTHSLLSYIPIKPDTNYYFRFRAYSVSGKASIRFGAINMQQYVPQTYNRNAGLAFSGSGYMNCNNGEVQNVGGGWTTYESVINSGNGDYFLFNAYWLQMAEYLCLGNFELVELSSEPLERIVDISQPSTITVAADASLTLPTTAEALLESGETVALPVTWLNEGGVDTANAGVYAVTGVLELGECYYYHETPYVRQRIVVSNPYPWSAVITNGALNQAELTCRIEAAEPISAVLYAASGSENRTDEVKSRPISLQRGEATEVTLSFSKPTQEARVFLWTDMMPLAESIVCVPREAEEN